VLFNIFVYERIILRTLFGVSLYLTYASFSAFRIFCAWRVRVLNVTLIYNVLNVSNYVVCWWILWHASINMFSCMIYCEKHSKCLFHLSICPKIFCYILDLKTGYSVRWNGNDQKCIYPEYKNMYFVFFKNVPLNIL